MGAVQYWETRFAHCRYTSFNSLLPLTCNFFLSFGLNELDNLVCFQVVLYTPSLIKILLRNAKHNRMKNYLNILQQICINYSVTILSLEWYFQNNLRWRCDSSKFLLNTQKPPHACDIITCEWKNSCLKKWPNHSVWSVVNSVCVRETLKYKP